MSLRVNKHVEFTVELELQCEYSAHSSLSYVESHLIKDIAPDNIFFCEIMILPPLQTRFAK
jgi:hypothetical protein